MKDNMYFKMIIESAPVFCLFYALFLPLMLLLKYSSWPNISVTINDMLSIKGTSYLVIYLMGVVSLLSGLYLLKNGRKRTDEQKSFFLKIIRKVSKVGFELSFVILAQLLALITVDYSLAFPILIEPLIVVLILMLFFPAVYSLVLFPDNKILNIEEYPRWAGFFLTLIIPVSAFISFGTS